MVQPSDHIPPAGSPAANFKYVCHVQESDNRMNDFAMGVAIAKRVIAADRAQTSDELGPIITVIAGIVEIGRWGPIENGFLYGIAKSARAGSMN